MCLRKQPDFKQALALTIQLKRRPGVLLKTLKDAVKFIGSMKPWHQTQPYSDCCAAEIVPAQNLSGLGIGLPMRIETDDLGSQNGPLVVDNACVSGAMASERCDG